MLAFGLIFLVILNLAGCEGLRKKFTRKKKETVKMPRIHEVKEYEKKPTPELYKKHYVYWTGWQSELIKVLGANHKKDTMCIEEIVGNLTDMQNMLVKKKADELNPHIEKMVKVKDMIFNEELTFANRDYIKRVLEREDRAIKKDFYYDKVKDSLKKNFDDEDNSK